MWLQVPGERQKNKTKKKNKERQQQQYDQSGTQQYEQQFFVSFFFKKKCFQILHQHCFMQQKHWVDCRLSEIVVVVAVANVAAVIQENNNTRN